MSTKPKNDNTQARITEGHSYNEEADRDFREGIANIKKFEHFGGLSLYPVSYTHLTMPTTPYV